MIWRVGRRVGRTIYAQQTWEPQDSDKLIGLMDTPDLAERVVQAVNNDGSLVGFGDGFRYELQELIHKHSVDAKLGTPDFVLADYLIDTLWHLGPMLKALDDWEGGRTGEAEPPIG